LKKVVDGLLEMARALYGKTGGFTLNLVALLGPNNLMILLSTGLVTLLITRIDVGKIKSLDKFSTLLKLIRYAPSP
jgi:hypothetical protein